MADGRNVFLGLIDAGRIKSEDDLKSAYRKAAKKAHPDSGETDGRKFVTLKGQYDDAREYLRDLSGDSSLDGDPQADFFEYWEDRENLEQPMYAAEGERKKRLDALMEGSFAKWHPEKLPLYQKAMADLARLRAEKPPNDLDHLRKPLLYTELKPLIYDICQWEQNGREVHRKLIRRIYPTLCERLKEEGNGALSDFFHLISAL